MAGTEASEIAYLLDSPAQCSVSANTIKATMLSFYKDMIAN
jgi:hypothetical protein